MSTKTNMELRSERRDQALRDCDRLNRILPVRLVPQDVDGNPEFVKLLSGLAKQVNEQGLSVQTQKDLTQSEELVRHDKHSWLVQETLYHQVQELVLDYQIKAQRVSLATQDRQFLEILRQCLTYADIGDYLDFSSDPTSKVQLLGLSNDDVKRHNNHRKHVPSLQQKLIPEIEDILRKKCENLVTFYYPSKPTDSTRLPLSKAVQLPSDIESSKHRLAEEKKQLNIFRQERDKQFWLYYQTLLDTLAVLEKLLREYKLNRQVETDIVNSEWLTARCDAMCLKIKLVELEIQCDTYTSETVQALENIRKHVDSAIGDHEKDLVRFTQALRSYEAVGMGFDKLVEEYSQLRAELENKQWALAELQQNANSATG